jgi:hypothetical protein
MARQRQRAHSVSKRFLVQSIFERRGPVESDLSIAPREGMDFFAKRDEYFLPFPVEIRIDEAVQVARERKQEHRRGVYRGAVEQCGILWDLFCASVNPLHKDRFKD